MHTCGRAKEHGATLARIEIDGRSERDRENTESASGRGPGSVGVVRGDFRVVAEIEHHGEHATRGERGGSVEMEWETGGSVLGARDFDLIESVELQKRPKGLHSTKKWMLGIVAERGESRGREENGGVGLDLLVYFEIQFIDALFERNGGLAATGLQRIARRLERTHRVQRVDFINESRTKLSRNTFVQYNESKVAHLIQN